MMAERGFEVDHSSVHRWVIKLVPLFEKALGTPKTVERIPNLGRALARDTSQPLLIEASME